MTSQISESLQMDTDRRKHLQEKKERLQQLLALKKYTEKHIRPWLGFYNQLVEAGIQPEVHYLASTFDLEPELLRQAVDEHLQADQKFLLDKIITEESLPVHEKLEEFYPSSNPIRYMPDSEKKVWDENAESMIKQAITELDIPEQNCLVLYPVYSPVMELALSDILSYCDVIIDPMTDVAIIAKDYSWLIFHSLEEEWVWVKS